MEINVKCKFRTGVSKKTGEEYICAELDFGRGFKKVIFPKDNAEKFIFEYFLMEGDSR